MNPKQLRRQAAAYHAWRRGQERPHTLAEKGW